MIKIWHTPVGWMWSSSRFMWCTAFRTADAAARDAWEFLGGKTPALIFPRRS